MKIIGILTEYNPFHQGHLKQLETIKSQMNPDAIIILMSGGFTQRGEPAIQSKWARAEIAIKHGADIVLEYPASLSTLPASDYAYNAIKMMDNMGIITHQAFGVSKIDEQTLFKWADLLEDKALKINLNPYISKGLAYPVALESYLLCQRLLTKNQLSQWRNGNNILAIQYLISLKKMSSSIQPVLLPRDESYKSASEIRKGMLALPHNIDSIYLPKFLKLHMIQEPMLTMKSYEILFHDLTYLIIQEKLVPVPYEEQGMKRRLEKMASEYASWHELVHGMSTKRYSRARVQRFLIHQFLQYDNSLYNTASYVNWPYKLLGVRRGSEHILKLIKKQAKSKLVRNWQDDTILPQELIDFETRVSDLHKYLLTNTCYKNTDLKHHFHLINPN